MNFAHWYETEVVSFQQFIAEAVAFKGNVTRDKQGVLNSLSKHLQQRQVRPEDYKGVVDVIRHNYTTYDMEWRALERKKLSLDPVDFIEEWNTMLYRTAGLVEHFIGAFLSPKQQNNLSPYNQQWLAGKLRQVPQQPEYTRRFGHVA